VGSDLEKGENEGEGVPMQVVLKVGVMRSAGMESEVVGVSVSWMVSGERTWVSIGDREAERGCNWCQCGTF